MFDELLRALKDRWLAPAVLILGPRIPPTAVTLAAWLVGLAAAALAARARWDAALGAWLANRLLDGLDGALARAHGRQSPFGGYLDLLLDLCVYAAVPIGITLGLAEPRPWLPLAVLLATFYVNAGAWMLLGALLDRHAAAEPGLISVRMPPGLVGGFETIVFFSVALLWPARAATVFAVMAALVAVAIGQRVWWAWRTLPR